MHHSIPSAQGRVTLRRHAGSWPARHPASTVFWCRLPHQGHVHVWRTRAPRSLPWLITGYLALALATAVCVVLAGAGVWP